MNVHRFHWEIRMHENMCLRVICHFNISLCLKLNVCVEATFIINEIKFDLWNTTKRLQESLRSCESYFVLRDWDIKDRPLIIIIQPAGTSNKICFFFQIFSPPIHPFILLLFRYEISVLISSGVLAASQWECY